MTGRAEILEKTGERHALAIEAARTKILSQVLWVEPIEKITAVKEDPKDNQILEAAVAGHADCIVSQDQHLRKLGGFRGMPILTARDFVQEYGVKTLGD